jgi:hypothetical protein
MFCEAKQGNSSTTIGNGFEEMCNCKHHMVQRTIFFLTITV